MVAGETSPCWPLTYAGAVCVLQGLQGKNIYEGCCGIIVKPSAEYGINVLYNNDTSHDWTKSLPAAPEPVAAPPPSRAPMGRGRFPVFSLCFLLRGLLACPFSFFLARVHVRHRVCVPLTLPRGADVPPPPP